MNAGEAEAFARFAVFAGGATTEAAEAVTGADLDALQGLVDKQLLLRRPDPSSDARLFMLETVREYAYERFLADPDAAQVRERHCRHYLALAERAEPELFTRAEGEWLPKLDAEVDNFRAALSWSVTGAPALALRLAGLLTRFWDIRKAFAEGLDWLEAALRAGGGDGPIEDRARALRAHAFLMQSQGAAYFAPGLLNEARARGSEALELSREAHDAAGIAEALLVLADLEMAESFPHARQRALAQEALGRAQETGDDRLVALSLWQLALAVPEEQATREIEQAATALRKLGSSRLLVSLYSNAAYNAIKTGRPERAGALLAEVEPLVREQGDPHQLAVWCGNVGLAALFSGELDRARLAFDEQLRLCRELTVTHLAAEGLGGLAAIAARRGEPERAARLLGAATVCGPVGDADVIAHLEKQFFASARAQLEPRRWSEAHTAGAEMPFQQAIALR